MIKYIVMFVGLVLGLSFVGNAVGLWSIKFWGVKYENARREVFEQTQSYNHGMITNVDNLCLEYYRVDSDSHRNALKATIRHKVSAFKGEFPPHTQQCLEKLGVR